MSIEELIERTATAYELDYHINADGAENADVDKIDGDTLWQSVVDDGSISINKRGQAEVTRHVRLMFMRPVDLDGKGEEWNRAKRCLMEIAQNFTASFLYSCEVHSLGLLAQPATYECGYDKFDANVAYALVHVYIKTTADGCPKLIQ